jgi:hypothetical protein
MPSSANSRAIWAMLLTSRAVQGRILGHWHGGVVKLSMKNSVSALIGLFAIGWSGLAFAQATDISTACPTNFTCAFSAAETMSLVTPKPNTPGQPDVYLGYLAFDGSGNVTMTGQQNVNGTVSSIGTGSPAVLSGTCTSKSGGQPAIITFPGSGTKSTQLSFVKDNANTELQFILTQDLNSASTTSANSVRIGVCRQ